MNDLAVRTEGLGKRYRLGVRDKQDTLVGAATSWIRSPLANYRRLRRLRRFDPDGQDDDVIWALRDISMEVRRGEVVGVIGANGAGKSTLLKILSRITTPSEGSVELRGRVGSLLEVGTGFHGELTGRENVYLNGTILGMSRHDVRKRFDEMVEFSGVSRFIDTPVKWYSSGMKVRLAFAVAAFLEPEILLVDEVLSVGDASFQKKCLGKMRSVTSDGRTVIFVSHVMPSVKSLCSRALLLEDGGIAYEGSVDEAVGRYLKGMADPTGEGSIPADSTRMGTGEGRFDFATLQTERGMPATQFNMGDPVVLHLEVLAESGLEDLIVEIGISSADGTQIAQCLSRDPSGALWSLTPGRWSITVRLDGGLLPGSYLVNLGMHHSGGLTVDWLEGVRSFDVLHVGDRPQDNYPWTTVRGYVRLGSHWDRDWSA